jgi:glyoxylate carboligase
MPALAFTPRPARPRIATIRNQETEMAKMKAAMAAVLVMEKEGVTQAFGVPGAAINPLYAQLRERQGIAHILARHVEGASHMAEGYTRAKAGNIGVCIGTSGPAGTDMITGLYSAQADSIPILCITGQAPRARLHKEDFQAVDIASIAKPVTKWATTVMEPALVPRAFQQAFHLMRSGRPGPGADRPAVRRADGRDRVRHRHLRAAAGLQARASRKQDREGAGHAGRRPSAR